MKHDLSDTNPGAADRLRHLLAARSAGQRLRMACEMFDSARRLALASLPKSVQSDPVEWRVSLLRRFYQRDIAPAALEAIGASIRRYHTGSETTRDSTLRVLNEDQRTEMRRWLTNWDRVGPILERERRTRVALLTDDQAWDESQELLQAWQPEMVGDCGEGIRLQQDLFARCRKNAG